MSGNAAFVTRERFPSLGASPPGPYSPCAFLQKEARKPEQGSLEDLAESRGSDETDRPEALSPQPSEPVCIQRRSPLIRNRKAGSMEVLSESSKSGGYRLFSYSRHSSEGKQSGLGSQCSRLFSTTVLGGSSSAPNLQDYARSHGKKFASSFLYKDELLSMPAIKRFSVSFAKHPTNGGDKDHSAATGVRGRDRSLLHFCKKLRPLTLHEVTRG
ncbi:inositol hexakisphosphate and diphosphoinositol-pentakisphosphate kinase 1-like [Python bivittatus]|uniref:Inositol hexakisphosphate and diphosphoinositol-pentakisphosphate kinase 1-like n=1 Tax=Python bivittatus TaxID=176946 RepID=A0A9F5J9W4_PYTBI|nr:inositol hexakisphosphate and diphosphoinositol-pentakisphosphate kinase 1-like [Python bivittatus]